MKKNFNFNFSNFIYEDKLKYSNNEFLLNVLNSFDNKSPTRDTNWNCYVETSHRNKHNSKPLVPDEFIQLLNNKLKKVSKKINDNFFNNLFVNDIWYNVYTKNMYQENHRHYISLLSGIFYFKFDKEIHSPVIFHNNFFHEEYFYSDFSDVNVFSYTPNVDEGSLIIFPGYMFHEVKPQTTDIPRITIAFNITNNQITEEFINQKTKRLYS